LQCIQSNSLLLPQIQNSIIMEKLLDALNRFEEEIKTVKNDADLTIIFKRLAPKFLYGGYIQVRDEYKVYIRTVEFYFHSEETHGIHDPIVYHRNGRDLKAAPYFPLMTLHSHNSGFDITFEKEGKYRASVLIRAYEIIDKDGFYLKWEKIKKDEKDKYMFVSHIDYQYNTQSTYLKAVLNGFPLGNDNGIKWIDSPRESKENLGKPRQNVFLSESEWEYKPIEKPIKKKCERKWSFTREEQV